MHKRSRAAQAVGLVAWLLVSYAAAAVGGIASSNSGGFYAELVRPEWAPPGWVFGPVWTVLYAMMGVAVWLVWRAPGGSRLRVAALSLFVVQLVFNGLWTWVFFAWRQGLWSFVEIVALWLLIAATAAAFGRISRVAALLLLPYLVWVTYAAALTWALWRMNPGVLP